MFHNANYICSIVLSGCDMRFDVCFARFKLRSCVPEFNFLFIYFFIKRFKT